MLRNFAKQLTVNIKDMENGISETLELNYKSVRSDVQDCWDNPLKPSDRLTREWIYAVDPETMNFINVIHDTLKIGHRSIYDTFCEVLDNESLLLLIENTNK